MTATIRPWTVTRLLLATTLVLVGLSAAGQIARYLFAFDGPRARLVTDLFYAELECNVPAWFSAAMLLAAAALLGWIGAAKHQAREPFARHWIALAVLFALMSVDESAQLHEKLNYFLETRLDTGAFFFPWVIAGAAFVLLVAVLYWPFLRHLPLDSQRLFLVAGAVYVGGALGAETIANLFVVFHGHQNLPYALLSTAEEMLEMVGLVIWLHALLLYVSRQHLGISVRAERATGAARELAR